MRALSRFGCAGAVAAAVLLAGGAAAQEITIQRELLTLLQTHMGLSAGELATAYRGRAVAKVLKAGDRREIAVSGIIRVDATQDHFVERFRDIARFKTGDAVLQVGKFSQPPRLEDLQSLTFDPREFDELRRCKVGDCEVRLPAEVILRFRNEIDWSAPDARERAGALAREALVDYVRAYLAGGNPALSQYHDRKNPLRLADEIRSLLRDSPYLGEHAPEFLRYLEEFPAAELPGVEDFVYWSKEKFGLKPVVSLTHVTIYRRTRAGLPQVLIASKQIYASHYFDASLGLTTLTASDGTGKGFYLLYLNRSRADALRGALNVLKRSVVEGRSREVLETNLQRTRARLEAGSLF